MKTRTTRPKIPTGTPIPGPHITRTPFVPPTLILFPVSALYVNLLLTSLGVFTYHLPSFLASDIIKCKFIPISVSAFWLGGDRQYRVSQDEAQEFTYFYILRGFWSVLKSDNHFMCSLFVVLQFLAQMSPLQGGLPWPLLRPLPVSFILLCYF